MTRQAAVGARFRNRKLSTKQALQILREDQVEKVDDDQQRNIPKVDTGVEKGEEIEHHLQAAISASQAAAVGGKVAQIYIPTPDTIQSNVQYGRLYPLRFSQPATYIRFSSTVEDCSGCAYCMSKEDDVFLGEFNQGRDALSQCSEDRFEEIMDFFEQTARSRQPFAAVDNPPVVAFEEMESSYGETIDEISREFAKEIYEYWKTQRLKKGNKQIMPYLKVRTLETGQESDDADPYVCFRRREVRQVRKTRGRDAQSIEKLKKLRRELEDSRQLLASVKQREVTKREVLAVDKTLFEQRARVKDAKRKLGIKGDDEDLINQKPQKKKTQDQVQRPAGPQLRLPTRPDGRPAEADLVLLQTTLAERENEIQKEIDQKVIQHRRWNEGYLDFTRLPLTPVEDEDSSSGFRTAIHEYLPTPPQSASSDASAEAERIDPASPSHPRNFLVGRNEVPKAEEPVTTFPSFRRRIGRGGRVMIDRRGMPLRSKEGIDPALLDRFKYDQDNDDEHPVYSVDHHDATRMQYRAMILGQTRDHAAHRAGHAARSSQHDVPMMNAPRPGSSGRPDGSVAQR